jgi:hypothetical protein
MAKKVTRKGNGSISRRVARKAWTKADTKELKAHSKAKTPVTKISKAMKRTIGALRRKAGKMGLPLGHRR